MIAGLLTLACLVRVAVIAHYPYSPRNDGKSYLRTANAIFKHGTYHDGDHAAGDTRGPSAYFPPAYSYLLSIADRITGGPGLSPATVAIARVMQALLGTASVALIGLIAFELFGATTALIALAMAALYPVMIELDSVIVAENLLTLLELGAVYSVLRARRSGTPLRWVVGTGVIVGLAILTHTNSALLLIPLGFGLRGLSRVPRLRRVPNILLMVIVALITITPWLIRDYTVFHEFVPVSTEDGITLVGTYNSMSARADPTYRWFFYGDIRSLRRYLREAPTLTEPQLASKLEGQAFSYIGHHPLAPLSVGFHNTLRLLELEGSWAWKISAAAIGLNLGLARYGVLSFYLLLIVAIAGLRTQAVRRVPRWLWGVPLVMWLSVVFINAETPRFREPLDPFLILLAATALAAALDRLSGRRASAAGTAKLSV